MAFAPPKSAQKFAAKVAPAAVAKTAPAAVAKPAAKTFVKKVEPIETPDEPSAESEPEAEESQGQGPRAATKVEPEVRRGKKNKIFAKIAEAKARKNRTPNIMPSEVVRYEGSVPDSVHTDWQSARPAGYVLRIREVIQDQTDGLKSTQYTKIKVEVVEHVPVDADGNFAEEGYTGETALGDAEHMIWMNNVEQWADDVGAFISAAYNISLSERDPANVRVTLAQTLAENAVEEENPMKDMIVGIVLRPELWKKDGKAGGKYEGKKGWNIYANWFPVEETEEGYAPAEDKRFAD